MRTPKPSFSVVFLFSVFFLSSASPASAQNANLTPGSAQTQTSTSPTVPPRITQAIDESNRVTLRGNVHPLARPEYDQGTVSEAMPMKRILMLLQRSAEQESALEKLLEDQQSKSSASYHAWLTSEQFGRQFGPADADVQSITDWLTSRGFIDIKVGHGRTVIEFSGNVAQVRDAFHTEIHRFLLNGEEHTANTTDPQIPAALAPVVAGIVSLHNFRKQPQIKSFDQRIAVKLSPESEPQVTFPNGLHALGPGDYAVIYNMNPILQGPPGISGPPAGFGTAIAIVGRSNININDVSRFWGIFNVRSDSPQVFLDGPDPGNLGGGEEAEAVLDTSWSGALAPGAAIKLVVSASTEVTDGADLSELYIVDNDVGQIMSESFSGCEAMATSAQVTAVSQLAEQAAAEGITYIVGSGDTGSAGCDHLSETTATGPLSVNLLASTPFTVAVGGTQFNENGNDSLYWSSTNNQSLVSVLRYIPENVWNESCAAAQCGQSKANIAAGGGGASMYFSKPRWQSGIPGIPNDGMRDVPDVALAAAGGHDPYLLCLDNSCLPDAQGRFSFVAVGGTSAAAPAFAAIMALVNSAVVPLNNPARLGRVNNVLYALAAHESLSNCNGSNTSSSPASNCVFNDVTVGNNAVPGEAGYGTATAKYQSGSGYDLASGLGSVNVTNLVNNWTKTFSQTTTTLGLNPTTFTHGTPVQVNISVTSQNGTPTGDVSLYTSSSIGLPVPGNSFTLNSSGSVLATTKMLPGGGGSLIAVTAHYAGDGTFGWSDSTPVALTVTPENSSTFLHIMTPGPSSGAIYTANTVAYGSPYILRADVTNASDGFPANGVPICGTGCPTGKVVITANGQPLDAGMFSLNSLGYTEHQSIQLASSATPYALHAAYQGDFNFNGSVSDLSVTITQAQTGAAVGAQPSTGVTTATLVTLTATVTTQSNSTSGPSGTVTFFNNGTPIGNPVTVASLSATKVAPAGATASLQTTFPAGSQSITGMYNGDVNYAPSPTSNPLSISVSQAPPGFIAAAAGVIIFAGGLGSHGKWKWVSNGTVDCKRSSAVSGGRKRRDPARDQNRICDNPRVSADRKQLVEAERHHRAGSHVPFLAAWQASLLQYVGALGGLHGELRPRLWRWRRWCWY